MKLLSKKIGIMIITMVMVSFLVFLCFRIIPTDPAVSQLGMNATPEAVEALREELGLNRPLMLQYFTWITAFVQGDMGISYSYGVPVTNLIADKLPITLTLTLMSFLIILGISIPIGVYTAKHAGKGIDRSIYIVNQITMAIPPFFLGIIMIYLFGLVLHFFVPGGFVSYETNWWGFIGYMITPAIAIALPKSAMTIKLLRNSVLEQMKLDYVRTAYSRGNDSSHVLYLHVLKNAILPVVTFLGMVLADILASSIIIEQVFGIPGLGRILLSAISNSDYPLAQAIIVCIAFCVILINFIVDMIYLWIDPRLRKS